MPAKNSISVKIEKEPFLLAAFLKCRVTAKRTRTVSETHVSYVFNVPHHQTIFDLGYWFSQLNR